MPQTQTPDASAITPASVLGQLLYRPIVFMPAERKVAPASWLEHVPFAFWLVDVLRPATFVELGTQAGNSYAAFAQAVQHLGIGTACYAVDSWKGDPQAGLYGEEVFEEWRRYHDERFSAFSRLVRSTFDEAASQFANGSIDLLHIDGYHTYEAVSHDLSLWIPRMSRRGIVLLHDINVREGDFGAWRAWEDAKRRAPSFEFLHGHGLGVLAVGSDLPPEVNWLCASDRRAPHEAAKVRQFFARVGRVVLGEHLAAGAPELDGMRAALAAAEQALEAERAEHRRTREELDRLREQSVIEAPAGEARRFESQVQELEREVREREDQARALEREVQRLASELAGLEKEAARARAERETARAARAVQDSEIAALWRKAASLEGQRSALEQALRTTERQLGAARRAAAPEGAMAARPSESVTILDTLTALGVAPRQVAGSAGRLRTALQMLRQPSLLRTAHLIARGGLFDAKYYRELHLGSGPTRLTPFAHFILLGGREGRACHPLFDPGWYLEQNPDVAASGANPLAHYIRTGSRDGRDPHPLFSQRYYLDRYPDLPATIPCLLQHYVEHGWLEGRTPHPLFDPDYYTTAYPDVAAAGVDPLRHYVERGWRDGYNPNPLFDAHDYLARYEDVRTSGTNPLVHYVLAGGRQGRQPHPLFDARFYLSHYPDVAASGLDPLSHYLVAGAAEGRDPSSTFSTREYLAKHPDVAEAGLNPLVHYVRFGRREGRNAPSEAAAPTLLLQQRVRMGAAALRPSISDRRVVLCLTHVMPVTPRAGNEYRIHRMLRWLHASGYTIVPIIAFIDDSRPSAAELEEVVREFSNVIYCPRHGQIEYVLQELPDVVRSLDGEYSVSAATLLGETAAAPAERELLQIERTFCTDALVTAVLRLQQALGPYVLLAEYIWMSRVLPLASRDALKVIDTHDVLSTRREKVEQFGIDDWTIDADAERVRLQRADIIVAIQENERRTLDSLVPGARTVTAGVDFEIVTDPGEPVGAAILFIGSGNPMNRRGLADFLRFAWPTIAAAVPDAELLVAGAVSSVVVVRPDRVRVLGYVADLEPLYRACRLVINPAVAGTGLKVKTLEALAHLRPIVTWPNGVDGLSDELAALCVVAQDWYEFARRVIEVLSSERRPWFSPSARALIAECGSADRVYAELAKLLEAHFREHNH